MPRTLTEIAWPECAWKQIADCRAQHLVAVAHADNLRVRVELVEHLPAGPARSGQFRRRRVDDNQVERRLPRHDHLKDGIALRTHGQAVGRVLDIAPGEGAAAGGPHRGPDSKGAVRTVRPLAGEPGLDNQVVEQVVGRGHGWLRRDVCPNDIAGTRRSPTNSRTVDGGRPARDDHSHWYPPG